MIVNNFPGLSQSQLMTGTTQSDKSTASKKVETPKDILSGNAGESFIDLDKVQEVKKLLAEGQYKVNIDNIANAVAEINAR